MNGLLSVQVLGVLDTEAEEIAQLGGRVDLGLPGILALAVHGQSHDVIAVFGRDQVSGLEEDAGTVGERGGSPRLASLKGGVDSSLNLGGGGVGVSGHGRMGGGVALGLGLGALDLWGVRIVTIVSIIRMSATNLLAGNHQRHIEGTALLGSGEGLLETTAVRRSGGVVFLRLSQ